jgi:type II secretory pathway component PulC
MTRRLIPTVLFMLAVLLFAAKAGMPAKKISYDTYRMVRTRNIFDPDRRAMAAVSASASASASQNAASSAPVTQSDYVALNGILITSDKALAFFSGSRAEYNKVLPVQDAIAGAKLVRIMPDSIVVERDGKQITVAVGQTVPLDGSAPAAAPAAAPVPAISSPTSQQTSSPDAPAGGMSEQARRMMERRQKELQ